MQFIDLGAQQKRIRSDLDRRMAAVLAHGQYILGPEVAELEAALASRANVRHCIGVANGTDALQLAMMALKIGPGDEVITPSFSYIAAAEAIALLGATPVFVDVNPVSYNVDVQCIKNAITDKTRAIIPVDLFGQCADYEAIAGITDHHGIAIIEDGAQSFGATRNGRPACAFGAIATTSFFPSKPLGCYGDGGACFTDDDDLAAMLRSLRKHGEAERYHHVRVGINARLDTLQAAIVLAKLEVFDAEIEQRQAAAQRYDNMIANAGLSKCGIAAPQVMPGNTSVWAQYTIRTPNRAAVMDRMKAAGIPTTIHYPRSLHEQPVFAHKAVQNDALDHSSLAAREVLSLPMHPYLEAADQQRVVDALTAAING